MSDPSQLQLEPETVGKAGGVLVLLLGLFKFLFTSGVSDVKTEVAKINVMVATLTTNVAALTTAMAVANEGRISRKEFEELKRDVDRLSLKVDHIEQAMRQGVVP